MRYKKKEELPKFEESSIFRTRDLQELPSGSVNEVHVALRDNNIASVELLVEDKRVSLLAGEVYEQHDGTFSVLAMDENILVQVDGRRPTVSSSGSAQLRR